MQKIILLLVCVNLFSFSFSQEINSVYKFKKQTQKRNFDYIELDSLVLYKNGEFFQSQSYQYHQVNYSEYKGNWKVENGILILNVKIQNDEKTDKVWRSSDRIVQYKLNRKKLIPVNLTLESYAIRKLKRVNLQNGF